MRLEKLEKHLLPQDVYSPAPTFTSPSQHKSLPSTLPETSPNLPKSTLPPQEEPAFPSTIQFEAPTSPTSKTTTSKPRARSTRARNAKKKVVVESPSEAIATGDSTMVRATVLRSLTCVTDIDNLKDSAVHQAVRDTGNSLTPHKVAAMDIGEITSADMDASAPDTSARATSKRHTPQTVGAQVELEAPKSYLDRRPSRWNVDPAQTEMGNTVDVGDAGDAGDAAVAGKGMVKDGGEVVNARKSRPANKDKLKAAESKGAGNVAVRIGGEVVRGGASKVVDADGEVANAYKTRPAGKDKLQLVPKKLTSQPTASAAQVKPSRANPDRQLPPGIIERDRLPNPDPQPNPERPLPPWIVEQLHAFTKEEFSAMTQNLKRRSTQSVPMRQPLLGAGGLVSDGGSDAGDGASNPDPDKHGANSPMSGKVLVSEDGEEVLDESTVDDDRFLPAPSNLLTSRVVAQASDDDVDAEGIEDSEQERGDNDSEHDEQEDDDLEHGDGLDTAGDDFVQGKKRKLVAPENKESKRPRTSSE